MRMNKLPVIVIFCYNRLSHLKKTVLSLENNYNYKKYKVYIFSDGAKNNSDKSEVKKVRVYINSLKNKKIQIIKNKKNLGLKKNVIKGLNIIFKKHRSAIIIEDDLILNKNFLNYMTKSIYFYSNKKNIGSISSYTPIKPNYLNNYKDDVYFSRRHFSWGWATWSNIWNEFIFSENKLNKMLNEKHLNEFSKIGKDLPILLKLSINNKISSWSIFFDFNCYLKELLCVCPKFSIVKNTGFDNSGTHDHQVFLNNYYKKIWVPKKFIDPRLSENIEKQERLSIEGSLSQKFKNNIVRIKDLLYKLVN